MSHSATLKVKLPEEQTESIRFPSPTYAVDAIETFDLTGLLVFTDANVKGLERKW